MVRIPLLKIVHLDAADPHGKFRRDFRDDIENNDEKASVCHYLYKTGKFLLTHAAAMGMAQATEDSIQAICNAARLVIKELMEAIIEEYGTDDYEYDLSGCQILEYKVFSIREKFFNWLVREGFEMHNNKGVLFQRRIEGLNAQ